MKRELFFITSNRILLYTVALTFFAPALVNLDNKTSFRGKECQQM